MLCLWPLGHTLWAWALFSRSFIDLPVWLPAGLGGLIDSCPQVPSGRCSGITVCLFKGHLAIVVKERVSNAWRFETAFIFLGCFFHAFSVVFLLYLMLLPFYKNIATAFL